ncbi:MAG TPA: hypothetical protein VN200_08335 [Rhodoglobus sp.]|nr:hypothetical protein [Rhodoglobus sp.]
MANTQDEPIQDGTGAGDGDRVDGILEQVRGDIALGHVSDPRDTLEQRLHDAGITVDADELDGLVASL